MPNNVQLPQKTETRARAERTSNMLSNVLAIIGFIILIVIVIWGLINAASLSGSWISSLFSRTTPGIVVSAPLSAHSGEPFTISWSYNTSAKGIYALIYQCNSGLQMFTPGPGGSNSIPCGAAYTVSSGNKTLSLTPEWGGTNAIDLPLSIVFIPTSGSRVQGSATVMISPRISAKPTEEKPAAAKPILSGPADLTVRITSATMDAMGNGTVTFDIANYGRSSSGTWYFEAQLPTVSGYTYYSPAQASLAPSAHIANTLRFSQGIPGAISIVVDPSNLVREASDSNNSTFQTVYAPIYPQQYQQPYVQPYSLPQPYPIEQPYPYPQPYPYAY